MKECSTCKKTKRLSEFDKRKKESNDGYYGTCKLCRLAIGRRNYNYNKPSTTKTREYNKQYAESHKKEKQVLNKKYYQNNKVKIKVQKIEP